MLLGEDIVIKTPCGESACVSVTLRAHPPRWCSEVIRVSFVHRVIVAGLPPSVCTHPTGCQGAFSAVYRPVLGNTPTARRATRTAVPTPRRRGSRQVRGSAGSPRRVAGPRGR
jgi:hypothetical protein